MYYYIGISVTFLFEFIGEENAKVQFSFFKNPKFKFKLKSLRKPQHENSIFSKLEFGWKQKMTLWAQPLNS